MAFQPLQQESIREPSRSGSLSSATPKRILAWGGGKLSRAYQRSAVVYQGIVRAIAGEPAATYQPDLRPPLGSDLSDLPNSDDSSGSRFLEAPLPSPKGAQLRKINPLLIAVVVTLASGLYFFAVGRNRYQVTSSFIVRLPQIPPSSSSSLLGSTLAGPTMLGSLEDGRFLAVYLTSPEVMKRIFLRLNPSEVYKKQGLDVFAGLRRDANFDEKLDFFRRQVFVAPQDLTGVINMTTTALDPTTSYKLNRLLLEEAENFLNKSNQSISQNQQSFAEQEVVNAKKRLDQANAKLSQFKNTFGKVSVSQEAQANLSYISELESQLVGLKVQEASLKRQFKDPATPEVAYVTDQIDELQSQIAKEKDALVSPEGEDYNQRIALEKELESEVAFAADALKSVMAFANDRRRESQQQIKFLVRLSDAEVPAMQSYDWRLKGFLAFVGVIVVVWGAISFTLGIASRK
jgi:capsular polysaccharide transport system permease protein